jgi:large subunit ribosomal protein L17
MAIIEFVDRDVEARKIDKPKKDINKESPKAEEKKIATA